MPRPSKEVGFLDAASTIREILSPIISRFRDIYPDEEPQTVGEQLKRSLALALGAGALSLPFAFIAASAAGSSRVLPESKPYDADIDIPMIASASLKKSAGSPPTTTYTREDRNRPVKLAPHLEGGLKALALLGGLGASTVLGSKLGTKFNLSLIQKQRAKRAKKRYEEAIKRRLALLGRLRKGESFAPVELKEASVEKSGNWWDFIREHYGMAAGSSAALAGLIGYILAARSNPQRIKYEKARDLLEERLSYPHPYAQIQHVSLKPQERAELVDKWLERHGIQAQE